MGLLQWAETDWQTTLTDNVIEKYIKDLTKIGKIRLGFMPGVYHLRNARKVLTKKKSANRFRRPWEHFWTCSQKVHLYSNESDLYTRMDFVLSKGYIWNLKRQGWNQ